jgi:hypothetical protein
MCLFVWLFVCLLPSFAFVCLFATTPIIQAKKASQS